jgi:hypothetical protein
LNKTTFYPTIEQITPLRDSSEYIKNHSSGHGTQWWSPKIIEGAAFTVKKRFSKPIRVNLTNFFSLLLREKSREEVAVAGSPTTTSATDGTTHELQEHLIDLIQTFLCILGTYLLTLVSEFCFKIFQTISTADKLFFPVRDRTRTRRPPFSSSLH